MRTRRLAYRPAAICVALAAAVAYGLVAPGTAHAGIVVATGSIINTGGCLDAFGNGGSGSSVDLWDCNNSPAQRFTMTSDDNGLQIRINGACVSVLTITTDGSGTTAYQAGLMACTGASNQQWIVPSPGLLMNSAGCLEAANPDTGYALSVNPCSPGDVNQKWSTVPIDLGPPLTGPNAGPSTDPAYILKVCTTVPNAAQIVVQGYGPQNAGFFYLSFNLGTFWTDYAGVLNWECAWTVNDVWRWWQPEVTPTTIEFLDSNGTDIGGVTAFKDTSGWYDNTGTYYACFVTNLAQPNPQPSC